MRVTLAPSDVFEDEYTCHLYQHFLDNEKTLIYDRFQHVEPAILYDGVELPSISIVYVHVDNKTSVLFNGMGQIELSTQAFMTLLSTVDSKYDAILFHCDGASDCEDVQLMLGYVIDDSDDDWDNIQIIDTTLISRAA